MRIAISDASTPIPQKMAIGTSGWLSDCSDEAAADGAGICTEMRAAFGMSVLQSVFGKIPAHGDVATFGAEVQCASDEFKNSSGGVRNRTAQLRYDFSSNRADRISWRCGHRVKSRPATGRGRRVLPDRVAPDGNSVALRKTALAARPKVIVGFHLRHFEQTDEHVEPVGRATRARSTRFSAIKAAASSGPPSPGGSSVGERGPARKCGHTPIPRFCRKAAPGTGIFTTYSPRECNYRTYFTTFWNLSGRRFRRLRYLSI